MSEFIENIELVCPICGNITFLPESDEKDSKLICVECKRKFSNQELIVSNNQFFDGKISDLKDDLLKKAAKDIKNSLKNAFKGNKNITIK